jgi:glutamate synthase (NADPH/NADH) large chain
MTGGTVVVLGPTGRNFAAGMSGGTAYLLDLDPARVNTQMVDLEQPTAEELDELRGIVQRHRDETGSVVAAGVLADWDVRSGAFTKIMPRDYKRVLEATREAELTGRDVDEAIMEAARG